MIRAVQHARRAEALQIGRRQLRNDLGILGSELAPIPQHWVNAHQTGKLEFPILRTEDYLGILRTVVFCSEDGLLVKGPGRVRRGFLDLLLSQTHPTYLPLLQRYAQALRSRKALLKRLLVDGAALEGFSRELVSAGDEIIRLRRELVPRFSPLARLAYRRTSNEAEDLRLEYQPSVKNDFAVDLAQSLARERTYRSTLIGPHRDELQMLINDRPARQFGSEGQKRTLAIALKMAQAEYLTGLHEGSPVLLIDDIMGELDLRRRSGATASPGARSPCPWPGLHDGDRRKLA